MQLLSTSAFAQSQKVKAGGGAGLSIDSLLRVYKTTDKDSIRIDSYIKIGIEMYPISSDSSIKIFKNALLMLVEKDKPGPPKTFPDTLWHIYKAKCYAWLSFAANVKSNNDLAIEYLMKGKEECKISGDNHGVVHCLNGIGALNVNRGNIAKALESFLEALKLAEKINDRERVAYALNNIGAVYQNQGEINKALEYHERALKIREEIKDVHGQSGSTHNLAAIYMKLKNYPEALKYFNLTIELKEKVGDKIGMAGALSNLGPLYSAIGEPIKAIEISKKALRLREEIGDRAGITASLNNLSGIYYNQKNYNMAIEFGVKSMIVAKEIGFPEHMRNAAEHLAAAYKAKGDHKMALANYELYIQMRDSINNESTRKASIKSQLKYEYEKQAAADSVANAKESEIKNVELKRQAAEIKAKKNQQYALFGGLFLVCLFGIFMFNRFKVTQKQKAVIEHQKEIVEEQKKIVEEKQHEILDSIKYARRIQMAQIPSEKRVALILNRLQNHEG